MDVRMCSMFNFILFFVAFEICAASYHEQYRVPTACSDKWESYMFSDVEYIVQNLPVKWEYAQILCRGHHNGTLAVLDTIDKAEFLAEALSESQFSLESVWVGARRSSSEDPIGYRWWKTGVPLRRTASDVLKGEAEDYGVNRHYPLWLNRTHVPVPEGGADCVAVDRVDHDKPVFLDLPCMLERPFVCEREAVQQRRINQVKLVRCKTGLYHLFDGQMSWDQAAAYCVMKKMSLANIASMKCLQKLGMTMLKTRPSIENAWVGARGELGTWAWMDTGVNIFLAGPGLDTDPAAWPPLRDRTTIKQNGCLQLDRHASHPPVFLEARCERKMQFICYQGTTSLGHGALRMSTSPPSDDMYYYVLVRQALYWQHAFENCFKMNGTLASVDNNDILIQLLLVMGENKDEAVDHIWLSGRLNMTRDIVTEAISYSWYNPSNSKRIPDPKSFGDNPVGLYMPPWLEDEFTTDNSCLNLDRQNHLTGLIYGLPCDTPQYSICMIEKSSRRVEAEAKTPQPVDNAENVA